LLPRARTATLLEILLALDGVPELNICLGPEGCSRSSWCAVHPIWQEAQDRMRSVLSSITLDELAAQSRVRRAGASAS
jgi:DNA-binding IscR family transcriptional regulator